MDVGKSKKAPVVHILDTQTHLQNAVFLKGDSVRDVYDVFMDARTSTYIGYTQVVRTDHVGVFM